MANHIAFDTIPLIAVDGKVYFVTEADFFKLRSNDDFYSHFPDAPKDWPTVENIKLPPQ